MSIMQLQTWFDDFLKVAPPASKLDELIDTSIKILDEIGVEAQNDQFLERVKSCEGILVKNHRIHFNRKYVQQFIDEDRAKKKLACLQNDSGSKSEYNLESAGFSFATIDAMTGKQRPATVNDLIELTKLGHVCGCSGPNPVFPQDLPAPMRALATYRYCYEYSDRIRGRHYMNIDQAKFIKEMARAGGFEFRVTVCFENALSINPYDLEILLHFLDEDSDFRIATIAYHMPGITGPISVLGCQALAFAEHIAGYILYKHIAPECRKNPVAIGLVGPTDLKSCCYAYGCSRTSMYLMLSSYMQALYAGNQDFAPPALMMTGSGEINAQAIADKTAQAMFGAQAGTKIFTNIGNLCIDDIASVEQFIIDIDIIEYMKNHTSMLDKLTDLAALDTAYNDIKTYVEKKVDFLMAEDTIDKFMRLDTQEFLFEYKKAAQWQDNPSNIIHKARARADELLATHQYRVDPDQLKAVIEVYEKAKQHYGI
jgi:trimethylamine:corrinoid methyltransferase-like protein